METKNTNNPNGRGKGNVNAFTMENKRELKSQFDQYLKDFGKDFKLLSPAMRAKVLIRVLKILMNGSDEVTEEVRDDIFKQMLPEFRNLKSYFSHLTPKERIQANLDILKLFTPEQKKKAIDAIKKGSKSII